MDFIKNYVRIIKEANEIIDRCKETSEKSAASAIAKEIRAKAVEGLLEEEISCVDEGGSIIIRREGGEEQIESAGGAATGEAAGTDEGAVMAQEENEEEYEPEQEEPEGEEPEEPEGPEEPEIDESEEDIPGAGVEELEMGESGFDSGDSFNTGRGSEETEEEEEEAAEETSSGESEVSETDAEAEQEDEPPEMPTKLKRGDFTCCQSKITITPVTGDVKKGKVIVSPFRIDKEHPEIIICSKVNHECSVVKSEGGIATVLIGGYQVTVKGHMDGGVFVAEYSLSQDDEDSGAQLHVESTFGGTQGHIVLTGDGATVHVFPAGSSNNKSGVADFFYSITSDGEEIIGDTSEGKLAVFSEAGKTYTLSAKWQDDTLFCGAFES